MKHATHTWSAVAGALALAFTASCTRDASADNSAMAGAVLQRAGQAGVFVDASTAEEALIRHAPSGMLCALPRDGAFDLEIFPPSAANEGAYCSRAAGGVVRTLLAVRFADERPLERAFADALARTVGQAANVRSWRGRISAEDGAPPTGAPDFRVSRFEATIDGAPHYLRVSMSKHSAWYVQQIVSAPLEQAAAAEADAGKDWRAQLRSMAAVTR